jgi:hypothetical protein
LNELDNTRWEPPVLPAVKEPRRRPGDHGRGFSGFGGGGRHGPGLVHAQEPRDALVGQYPGRQPAGAPLKAGWRWWRRRRQRRLRPGVRRGLSRGGAGTAFVEEMETAAAEAGLRYGEQFLLVLFKSATWAAPCAPSVGGGVQSRSSVETGRGRCSAVAGGGEVHGVLAYAQLHNPGLLVAGQTARPCVLLVLEATVLCL